MYVIVGLGNPGPHFAPTRHNAGFEVVAELVRRWRLPWKTTDHGHHLACGAVDGERIVILQPQSFMNVSGGALVELALPVSAADLIVVHDDVDLDCGRLRIKRGGGTGGHRGLESITNCYGPDFVRVRLGVGRPPQGQATAEYVLSPFADNEMDRIAGAIQSAADAVECVLRDGLEFAMNRFNTWTKRAPRTAVVPTGRS